MQLDDVNNIAPLLMLQITNESKEILRRKKSVEFPVIPKNRRLRGYAINETDGIPFKSMSHLEFQFLFQK